MNQELERLLDAVRSARTDGVGVRDWSIFISESRTLSLGIKDREIANFHAPVSISESCGARFRLIWDDGRLSRGYVERSRLESDPGQAIVEARSAAYEDPDAAWVMGPSTMPEVALHDETAARVACGDVSFFAPRLESVRQRIDGGGYDTWSGSFSAGEGASRLVTSEGLDVRGRGTTTGWHVSVNGEIGDGYSARRPEDDTEFESRLDLLLQTATLLRTPAEPMNGGILPILLHPGVVESYALGTVLDNLGGSTVAHGDGHFRRDQFGSDEPVMREDFALRLDPLQPYRRGSYRFTVEGVPAAPCSYIERGRLIQPVLDLKYARRLGLPPTPLPLGMDTLTLEGPTPLQLTDALPRAAGGVLILSVLGVHTQDSSSGDFSLSAPQALGLGPDGFTGKLRGTISGNLFEVLADEHLQLVRFEGETTPGLLFSGRFDPGES